MKSIFGGVMRVGRATVFLVGLAVILAVVFGVGSMALAANGKPFLLGKNNAAPALTTLVKQGPGPALRLLVRPGNPPMAVNSRVRVPNLNADKVDGKDARSFASADSAPFWAVVNADGTLAHGNGASAASREAKGSYKVRFDQNVSDCAYAATISEGYFRGWINTDYGLGSSNNVVIVSIFDEAGDPSDRPFHLVVTC